MRILFFILFWFLYFPLLRILALIFFWHSKIQERSKFEKKNKFEALAHSFREKGVRADLCFEFSSEGEYQQIAPLVEDALTEGKKIELVFFSPSVEKAIMKLAKDYPTQIRYLRYPFLRLFPFIDRRSLQHWVTSRTMILVRYDLFPDLLLWAMKRENTLRIVWMTFKKERSRGKEPSFWKKLFLSEADFIVYAGVPDVKKGEELGKRGSFFDFRIEQIRRRMLKKEEKFRSLLPVYPEFKTHLATFDKAVMLGNAWPSDLFLLRDLPADAFVMIVPHQLSEEILNLFREELSHLGREYFELTDSTTVFRKSNTVLVNKKGVLCELYGDFSHSYVGGGFEGSIHSVLEPLIAGSQKIACGPFHQRSTEYDIAKEWNRISEVNTPEQFMNWLNDAPEIPESDRMETLLKDYENLKKRVTSC